jgi:hypothetical protein
MAIKQIYEIPGMEKTKDGLGYPEHLVGKLFKFEDNYILFKEKSYEEFPVSLIDVVIEASSNREDDNSFITEEQFNTQTSRLAAESERKSSNTSKKVDDLDANLSSKLKNIKNELGSLDDKIKSTYDKIDGMSSPESIKAIISQELTAVHENYEKVIKGLIQEKATELAKDIKEAGNKLDPMTVMMYKKMGMELPDIIQMAKGGLI